MKRRSLRAPDGCARNDRQSWLNPEALDRARDAAAGMGVRIGGGPATIRQHLRSGLIDELHVAISPVLLGGGERLFEGLDARALGYECVRFVASAQAAHVVLRRRGHNDA